MVYANLQGGVKWGGGQNWAHNPAGRASMPLIGDGKEAVVAYCKRMREKYRLAVTVNTLRGPRVHVLIEDAGGKDVYEWVTFENLDAFVGAVSDIYKKNGISRAQKYSIGCHDIIDDAQPSKSAAPPPADDPYWDDLMAE